MFTALAMSLVPQGNATLSPMPSTMRSAISIAKLVAKPVVNVAIDQIVTPIASIL